MRHKYHKYIMFIILSVIILMVTRVAYGAGEESRGFPSKAERRVIILVLDRISLGDLKEHAGPVLQDLIQAGGVGLMNVNTAGRITTENSAVTLGASSRGLGGTKGRLAFGRDEEYGGYPAEAIYARHLGERPGEEEVIHPYAGYLEKLNTGLDYPFMLGALGEVLRQSGIETALIGNSDTDTAHHRSASMIIMDRRGRITYGQVGEAVLTPDESAPFGYRTVPEALWEEFERVRSRAGVIVIDWGDTFRLDEYRENLAPALEEKIMSDIFEQFDTFLSLLRSAQESEELLMIITPSPRRDSAPGWRLTPVVMAGEGIPGGLLYTPTTRRAGLVTSIDVAPTVLDWVGLEKPHVMLGEPFLSREVKGAVEYLLQEERNIGLVYEQRPALLKTYVVLQIVVILTGLAGLLTRFKPVFLVRPLMVSLLLVPLVLLVMPLIPFYPFNSITETLAVLIVTVAVIHILFWRLWRRDLHILAGVGLVTALVLVVDLLSGASLMKSSFLGYDPLAGARFYGIGNEYMGVLIGSVLIGGTALLNALPRRRFYYNSMFATLVLLLLVIIFLMASPRYGANFGGTIAASAAFGTTFFLLWTNRPLASTRYNLLLFVLLLLVAWVGVMFWLNVFVSREDYSHLGRFFELVRLEGGVQLIKAVRRKLSMNFMLIRYSIWSRVLITTLALLGILFYRPFGLIQRFRKKRPLLSAGFTGVIAGGITAFIVNDSGVVAAATAILYAGVPLLFLAFEEVFPAGKGSHTSV